MSFPSLPFIKNRGKDSLTPIKEKLKGKPFGFQTPPLLRKTRRPNNSLSPRSEKVHASAVKTEKTPPRTFLETSAATNKRRAVDISERQSSMKSWTLSAKLLKLRRSDLPTFRARGLLFRILGSAKPKSISDSNHNGPRPTHGPDPSQIHEPPRVYKEEISSPPGTSSKPYPIAYIQRLSNPYLATLLPNAITYS
ncbi:hypothetical protein PIB30_005755 [Stylosanthes scabra]|uniref:Uncharacterized protein n=1 Tax=Stylosanthes scabra TaxID=79078 RepID=A0ABU6W272_9FABA|nr:hypothetical protein [Stylosanthes scabra]